MVGLKETSTGHTLVRNKPILLEPIGMYQPVISIAVEPRSNVDQDNAPQSCSASPKKIPHSSCRRTNSYQTVVSGMGELHLDVIMRRLKEEFSVDVLVGKPQVVYKETIAAQASVEQPFEKMIIKIPTRAWSLLPFRPIPAARAPSFYLNLATTARFPFMQPIEEGIHEASQMGPIKGFPLTDIRVDIL